MAGIPGFEPGEWRSQSPLPYRLAISQCYKRMVGRSGFEPLNPKERIYSPPRLASSLSSQLLKWWRLTGSNRWPLACKASALPAELNLRSNGDPYGIRTRVTAVKGRCLNHLTNGPKNGSTGGTRTCDPLINSQMLLPTELLWNNKSKAFAKDFKSLATF